MRDITEESDFRPFARGVGTVIQYPDGAIIFRENDPALHMYVVLSGAVEMVSHGRLIETIGSGHILGAISMIDGEPRTATARAVEACELALLDRKKFRYMVEEAPNFVWFVMAELTRRLRKTNAIL